MTIATPKNIRSLSTSPYAYKNCLFQQSSNQFIPMMFHLCSIYQMKVPSDDSHSLLRSWFCYYTFISNWFFFFAGFCHFHPIISYSRPTLPSSDSLFSKHAPSLATIKVPKKKMTQLTISPAALISMPLLHQCWIQWVQKYSQLFTVIINEVLLLQQERTYPTFIQPMTCNGSLKCYDSTHFREMFLLLYSCKSKYGWTACHRKKKLNIKQVCFFPFASWTSTDLRTIVT
jgi:hypothetical protein